MTPKSRDGHVWTRDTGFREGIESDAVITPQRSISTSSSKVYDAIIIGAGYAGLIAARDLSLLSRFAVFIDICCSSDKS